MTSTNYTKTQFFEEFGQKGLIVNVHQDDVETGDYQLFCPEEQHIAKEWQDKGYVIASVFDTEDEVDIVVIDNDICYNPYKVGYIILDKTVKN